MSRYAPSQRVEWLGDEGPIAGTVQGASPFHAWIDWDDASFGIYTHDDPDVRLLGTAEER